MRSHANRRYSEVVQDQTQKATNLWMKRSITCGGWNRSNEAECDEVLVGDQY